MRLRRVVFPLLCLLATSIAPSCAGCSEECSGDNQGFEGCPCASDQDCTTRLGDVLLCAEGACTVGEPPDAPPPSGTCEADADCDSGEACGVDQICLPAPSCQRIEVELAFRAGATSTGVVTSSVDGCIHTWSVEGDVPWSAELTIGLDGVINVVSSTGNCQNGLWRAGRRLGELRCDEFFFAIGPLDVVERACVGPECDAACEPIGGQAVGVCP